MNYGWCKSGLYQARCNKLRREALQAYNALEVEHRIFYQIEVHNLIAGAADLTHGMEDAGKDVARVQLAPGNGDDAVGYVTLSGVQVVAVEVG